MRRFDDEDLTFIMHVSHEPMHQVRWCLSNVRSVYPKCKIQVISDGPAKEWHESLCREFGVAFFEGRRLFGVESGALIWDRFFSFFLESKTYYGIKIDPDTFIIRRFRALPESGIFGTRQGRNSLQGGCIIFTSDVAAKIYTSGVCLSAEFINPAIWVKSRPASIFRAYNLRLTSMDWTLEVICDKLSLSTKKFSEVRSRWKKPPRKRNYAVIHPVVLRNSIHIETKESLDED